MKKRTLVSCAAILALILACAGFAEGTGETTMDYRTDLVVSNGHLFMWRFQ